MKSQILSNAGAEHPLRNSAPSNHSSPHATPCLCTPLLAVSSASSHVIQFPFSVENAVSEASLHSHSICHKPEPLTMAAAFEANERMPQAAPERVGEWTEGLAGDRAFIVGRRGKMVFELSRQLPRLSLLLTHNAMQTPPSRISPWMTPWMTWSASPRTGGA